MKRIELTVDAPMASPRPRFRNAGKFVQTYMSSDYMKHKKELQKQMPKLLLDGPLIILIEFHFPMLKSWSKKKQQSMAGKYKITKPDVDNLIKTILDAGNNHLWADDNIVADARGIKTYSFEPRVIIHIEKVEGDLNE
ncbi:RusA family crossover junction endodeoxyribonuclease [Staphylococcus cohnii]|uniref:RusA family crossover junction endodeoxyribonuclease n=1 Tax=Staphylococcus cohnii TaxID=29382 RepID=UPI000CD0B448|nr:RusA family crossover junction endodeoxyribonuclease [Staphylococcus cohnii]AYX89326.1 RusA family crossover junction endodeoxyribonuclease [Staphylococcus cohnii]MCI2941743.1 RusA family crossover junction endodeoxyribonuclease [Staphylococcus cohnii]PNZ44638.1 RusA family crossover junction endodeoxyribonuclease [Staphylococcus cohnii subsp. cohnii]SUM09136.1 endodeoxyribonuclease RusA family protein [Staphylococcus cohnii]GEP86784.1 crossover junction endodeoxyribonuclease RuvA [Staphylo